MATSIERSLSVFAASLYFERISADPSIPREFRERAAPVSLSLPSANLLDAHIRSKSSLIPPDWAVSFRVALDLLITIGAKPSLPARTRYLARPLLRWFPDELMIRELSDPDSYLFFGPLLERLDEDEMSRLREWS